MNATPTVSESGGLPDHDIDAFLDRLRTAHYSEVSLRKKPVGRTFIVSSVTGTNALASADCTGTSLVATDIVGVPFDLSHPASKQICVQLAVQSDRSATHRILGSGHQFDRTLIFSLSVTVSQQRRVDPP